MHLGYNAHSTIMFYSGRHEFHMLRLVTDWNSSPLSNWVDSDEVNTLNFSVLWDAFQLIKGVVSGKWCWQFQKPLRHHCVREIYTVLLGTLDIVIIILAIIANHISAIHYRYQLRLWHQLLRCKCYFALSQ